MAVTYDKIATTTLGSDQATVTFSSISGSYTDLIVIFSGGVTADDLIYTRFNSDAGSNYSGTLLFNTTGGSVLPSRENNGSYLTGIGWGCAVENNLNNNAIMNILNYSNTTTFKPCLTRSNTPGRGVGVNVNMWRSTSAITSIQFGVPAGGVNIKSGSTFTLYGILKA